MLMNINYISRLVKLRFQVEVNLVPYHIYANNKYSFIPRHDV